MNIIVFESNNSALKRF